MSLLSRPLVLLRALPFESSSRRSPRVTRRRSLGLRYHLNRTVLIMRNRSVQAYHRLKPNFRVLHLITIFLGLMCYTKIRKDENKLSIIYLTLYSQSDHVLGENSLQSVVRISQSYFLCDRKSSKCSWNELFFSSLPSYFLFHNTCLQSKNW